LPVVADVPVVAVSVSRVLRPLDRLLLVLSRPLGLTTAAATLVAIVVVLDASLAAD
jgi:hypothetical protein